jgi:site-specific DNA-methyltransferase (adenine-specific)
MKKAEIGNATLYCGDCMKLMATLPDKSIDLAIVDPPYGIGENGSKNHTRSKLAIAKDYKPFAGHDLNAPDKSYFDELFRVSRHRVIFGANHFISRIPFDSSCWIVWDKKNSGDFADCELAWTSFKSAVRIFSYRWNGMIQEDMKNKEIRIHPTQKPVALYKWLLSKYAKPGMKILDTHFGSGSLAVACNDMGFSLVASEIDADYFQLACKRIKEAVSQQGLFKETA